MGSIGRSWSLVKEAWSVLKQDRELALFPILSGIVSSLVLATFAVPAILMLPWGELSRLGAPGSPHFSHRFQMNTGPAHYAGIFLYYLFTYFVVVFFNAGLVACVRKRFAGGDPTLRDGLSFSLANVGRLFQWALLSATVGTALRAVEELSGWFTQLVAGLLGLAWSVATFMVVPVLVYEGVGPVEALKRSVATLKKTWGEALVGGIGMSAAFTLLVLGGVLALLVGIGAGIGLIVAGSWVIGVAVMGAILLVCIAYWTALGIVQSALQGIFLTACYEYATTGVVPGAFSQEYVVAAWRPKR